MFKKAIMIDFSEHPLIETNWLADHVTDINLRIVDMRWRGDGSGQELYWELISFQWTG